MEIGFQYDIEYDLKRTDPKEKARLEDRMQAELITPSSYQRLLSGLGGMLHTYGFIWHDDRDLTDDDRNSFIRWSRAQPIDATIRIGAIEDLDIADFNRELTETVFEQRQATPQSVAEAESFNRKT